MYNAHSVTQITDCGEYWVKNKHIDLLILFPKVVLLHMKVMIAFDRLNW